jgi:membrane protein DedA with SNARE-associated domain
MTAALVALIAGTLVSEDLTGITAGLLVRGGDLSFGAAVGACAFGIFAGDLGLWLAGRILGPPVLRWPRVAGLLAGRERDFAGWFDGHAAAAIVGSRFTPGARLPLYLAAGASQTSFRLFAAWSAVAVAFWTPLLVGAAAAIGGNAALRLEAGLASGRMAVIGGALVAFAAWRVACRAASRRGRQQLIAAVSRIWRWEFWPMWLFYPPVLLWTAWLAVRFGGYRTITAANPGMPDGGVVGESKFAILSRLPSDWTVPSALLTPGPVASRRAALQTAVAGTGWMFPLVLKPDVGQRGAGVKVVRSMEEADAYLARETGPVLAQPYHPGPFEAGVFYYRMPGGDGRILAITDKHFPEVTGDGRSTLADLVWAHRRHRMQAATFIERLGDRRQSVPADGERVALGIVGNHAQGAMFTDGGALRTTALEARIDGIARAYDGFYIGRFDIRYRTREAFMAGRDLAIVELNGATAECTSIYDPAASLWSAYATLARQWSLVFAIGAANRRAGRPASSARRLAGLVREHLTSRIAFPISD